MKRQTARSLAKLCHLTLLFALLLTWAPAAGHASPVGAPSAPAVTAATAPAASFLATLSGDGAELPPAFLASCTSNAQCPAGQLCCRACGFPGCTAKACFVPMNGHCPLIP